MYQKNPMGDRSLDKSNHTYAEPVNPAYVQAYPTAPAQVVTARVVQPMYITSDECTPLREDELNDDTSYTMAGLTHPQSNPVNQKVAQSATDGFKMVHEERKVARQSSITGSNHSRSLNGQISYGNSDMTSNRVDIHGIQHPMGFDITQVNDFRYDATKDIVKKSSKSSTAPGGASEGYQIKEYKSIYETSTPTGDYQMSEYKSIYDP
jgi:hypothetical protein